jgi:hypothetical protein
MVVVVVSCCCCCCSCPVTTAMNMLNNTRRWRRRKVGDGKVAPSAPAIIFVLGRKHVMMASRRKTKIVIHFASTSRSSIPREDQSVALGGGVCVTCQPCMLLLLGGTHPSRAGLQLSSSSRLSTHRFLGALLSPSVCRIVVCPMGK